MNNDHLIDLQTVAYQLQQLEAYLQSIEQQLLELKEAINSVKEISKIEDSEAFVPLTSGIFVPAKILSVKSFLVNVGEKVLVEKSVEETLALLEEQENTLRQYQNSILEEFSNQYNKYLSLQLNGGE